MQKPIRTYKAKVHGQDVTVKVYACVIPAEDEEEEVDGEADAPVPREPKLKDLVDIFKELDNYGPEQEQEQEED